MLNLPWKVSDKTAVGGRVRIIDSKGDQVLQMWNCANDRGGIAATRAKAYAIVHAMNAEQVTVPLKEKR